MALSKKELQDITIALEFARKAKKYLEKDSTVVATKMLPHGLSFYNKDGEGITPLQKFAGSDLCYLLNAIDRLEGIVAAHAIKKFNIPVSAPLF